MTDRLTMESVTDGLVSSMVRTMEQKRLEVLDTFMAAYLVITGRAIDEVELVVREETDADGGISTVYFLRGKDRNV